MLISNTLYFPNCMYLSFGSLQMYPLMLGTVWKLKKCEINTYEHIIQNKLNLLRKYCAIPRVSSNIGHVVRIYTPISVVRHTRFTEMQKRYTSFDRFSSFFTIISMDFIRSYSTIVRERILLQTKKARMLPLTKTQTQT